MSSLSSEVFKPRLLKPWWDGCRQNASTYGETGLDDLKVLSQLLDLVMVMTESLRMISVQQQLWDPWSGL